MTVNDHHKLLVERCRAQLRGLDTDLESMEQVLSAGPAPKRDPLAATLSLELIELLNHVAAAGVHASLSERRLRYSRSAPAQEDDE